MEPILVKLSGNVAEQSEQLDQLAVWISHKQGSGQSFILVHGAGKQMNRYSEQMGLEVKMREGRRITDSSTLELITGVMGGIVNKTIVDRFRRHKLKAIGLSGVDADISTAHKRPPLSIQGEWVDFGYVGEVDHIDITLLRTLLKDSYIPVIASLTWSELDGILNVNADTFAHSITLASSCSMMIALMDVPAVRNARGENLDRLTKDEFEQGKAEGWINEGMIPKLTNAFHAIEGGVPKVLLTNMDGLITGSGTTLTANSL